MAQNASPPMQAEADLLPVRQPQPARPGHPGIHLPLRPARAAPRDDPDQLVRAADLAPDLPQRQGTGLQPQRQLPLLYRQMSHHAHSPRSNQRIVVDSPRLRAPVERAVSTISRSRTSDGQPAVRTFFTSSRRRQGAGRAAEPPKFHSATPEHGPSSRSVIIRGGRTHYGAFGVGYAADL